MPVPFLAEISAESTLPPNSSSTTLCCSRSCLTFCALAVRQVDLVDRDDHRHAGVPGVADRLDRLRHDLVVGRDDEDDDVGDLGAAGAHGGERLVARRVEEGDRLAARQRHVVRADVLRDAARLAGDDVGLPDVVEQRRLAVVDVAHDGDDRRPRHQLLRACPRRRRSPTSAAYSSSRTAWKPNADAISSIWSKSSRWLTVTIRPSSLNANWTIWVAGTFMAPASSDTETNSLTRIRVFSRSRSSASRPACDVAVRRLVGAAHALPAGRALHALQGLQDVRLHRILVHRRALALLALLPAAALLGVGTELPGRRRGAALGRARAGPRRSARARRRGRARCC